MTFSLSSLSAYVVPNAIASIGSISRLVNHKDTKNTPMLFLSSLRAFVVNKPLCQ